MARCSKGLAIGIGVLWLTTAAAGPQGRPTPELKTLLKAAIEDSTSFDDRFHAQVWLMDMSQRLAPYVGDPEERLAILKAVHREATRADLPPELVLAVIHVESLFDRFAISRVGARGLMQIMPFWLKEIGHPDDNLFVIDTNLRMGCTILRYYMDMEEGHWSRALARYNGSLGRQEYPRRVFHALRHRWYKQ